MIVLTCITSRAQVTEIGDIWEIKYHNRPMVVDVYATWCAPCHSYRPIFDRVAREYQDRVDFYRMDVDSPDAQNFIDITSVPTTVFIWDPKGDATVQHSEESGLLSYTELVSYVELTLAKQYSYESLKLGDDDWGYFESALNTTYPAWDDHLLSYVGVWQGSENGYETKLWVVNSDGEFHIFGGTLDPKRQNILESAYWFTQKSRWSEQKNALCLSDVLPDTADENLFNIMNGTLNEREFRWDPVSDKLEMRVNVYSAKNGSCEQTPFKTYTTTLRRIE